ETVGIDLAGPVHHLFFGTSNPHGAVAGHGFVEIAFVQELHDHRIVARRVHHDFAFERDGVHVEDVMAGHFSRRVIDHHAFKNTVSTKNEVHDSREVHDLGAASVRSSDQRTGGVRGIDYIHALAFRDLLAGHADLFEDLI